MNKESFVRDEASLNKLLERVRKAQERFAEFSQEQVDRIFFAAAAAADRARIPLAQLAVEETGMGLVEDKVIKNHYAAEYIYNAYKDTPTCGVIERDPASGIVRIAEPIGVIAAVVPTTNPTSTAVFKALLALKTRNGIVFSPHPRAKQCTVAAARIVLEAAVAAGAPAGLIGWIDEPSLALSNRLMQACDLTLATGGPGMVRAAYSSGKPAVGVGAGNTPAVIDSSADLRLAAGSILHSKTFDHGMICASEQSVIALADVYDALKTELVARGAYLLNREETAKLRKAMLVEGAVNPQIVGQSAPAVAELAGFSVPPCSKILLGEVERIDPGEPFAHEKLSPVLALYRAATFEEALNKAARLVEEGGIGHTASLFCDTDAAADRVKQFSDRLKACRILLNTPAAQGGIGDLYNFRLAPSLTLGCGSWGGNSVSENVGVKHLLNIKTVADRRENMLWFRAPEKIYFKPHCLGTALSELRDVYRRQKAFVVTDKFLWQSGMARAVTDRLDELDIVHTVFFEVEPDPTLACARRGAEAMRAFAPDVIVALGGGSPMDAAKIMWVLYEHPEVRFDELAMRFLDIRKRIYSFPRMGERAMFVAVPTTAGTGSEVTPFAVITDETTGTKYPLADYELLPDMAVVDAALMRDMPPKLTAASGIDSLTHALEAIASVMASPYTDGLAKEAVRLIFAYLPRCCRDGAHDPEAREKMADAATLAGMAFANAFLGVCHSMAHKLGSYHHLAHGVANALLIDEVIRFNSAEAPAKMGTFPQYKFPSCRRRYAEVADLLGLGGDSDEDKVERLLAAIDALKADIGIPASIAEAGVAQADFLRSLDAMVLDAFDDQCTGANPRYPLLSEIRAMYLAAYSRTSLPPNE